MQLNCDVCVCVCVCTSYCYYCGDKKLKRMAMGWTAALFSLAGAIIPHRYLLSSAQVLFVRWLCELWNGDCEQIIKFSGDLISVLAWNHRCWLFIHFIFSVASPSSSAASSVGFFTIRQYLMTFPHCAYSYFCLDKFWALEFVHRKNLIIQHTMFRCCCWCGRHFNDNICLWAVANLRTKN